MISLKPRCSNRGDVIPLSMQNSHDKYDDGHAWIAHRIVMDRPGPSAAGLLFLWWMELRSFNLINQANVLLICFHFITLALVVCMYIRTTYYLLTAHPA